MLALVNNCIAEMSILMPVSGGFIRLAGEWVDDAFGFMAGWNFCESDVDVEVLSPADLTGQVFYEALLIPFEITALNLVLSYWRDDIPTWAVCLACIVLYAYVLPEQLSSTQSDDYPKRPPFTEAFGVSQSTISFSQSAVFVLPKAALPTRGFQTLIHV